MGWNGSDTRGEGIRKPVPKPNGGSIITRRTALWLILVVIGIAVFWAVTKCSTTSGNDTDEISTRDTSALQVKKPIAQTTTDVKSVKPTKAALDTRYIEECEKRYAGKEMPAGLKTHLYYLKNPPKKEYGGMVSHPYLAHTSERDIASVLYVVPGTAFLEPPMFGDEFDNDFALALADNIAIEDSDTPEVRDAKLFVTRMKEELAKAARETGKKPSEIMTEQGLLMFEMGRFEQQLAENLREAEEDPELTDDDVADYFKAANALREKKGLAPHELPDLTRRTIRLKQELRRQAREFRRQNNSNILNQ